MTFDPSSINNIEINSFLNQNENDNNNLKEFDQIVNFILNDNENESIVDNNKNKKNNSQEKKKSFINNNDNSLFSLNLDLENKKNKEEDIRGNIIQKIDHSQKTIIPKIGKILEVKKLNFQNLNKELSLLLIKIFFFSLELFFLFFLLSTIVSFSLSFKIKLTI